MAPSLEEPSSTQSAYNNHQSQTVTNKQPSMENSTDADKLVNAHAAEPERQQQPKTEFQHIWYITGPAGCGKSTVAQYIATALQLPFLEGDNFHPQANITKMAEGHPLTDADRWDWLIALRTAATRTLAGLPTVAPSPNAGSSTPTTTTNSSPPPPSTTTPSTGVVLTCSALKIKYRDVLRIAAYNNPRIQVHFVYLHASEAVLLERVAARKGHYMGKEMVRSQWESLEVPGEDETDVITVGVGGTKEEVEREALSRVEAAVRGVMED